MPRIDQRTFAAVIRAYLASPKFNDLAEGTKIRYRIYLRHAEHPDALGAYPIGVIRSALVQAFLDGFADRPGAQSIARNALGAVEKWALPRDLLPYPITTGTEVFGSQGGHQPWTEAQIATAETYAQPNIARVITLGANTGQRGSDLHRMGWSDIEEIEGRPGIHVTQRKTGLQIWIPMTQELQNAIGKWQKQPGPFLRKPDNTMWENRHQMAAAWVRERDRNPQLELCIGLVLHGLRASAAIRLRRAGVPGLLIGDMLGMSKQTVERYCRHADQRRNALAAVHYLDKPQSGKIRALRESEKD